MKRNLKVTGTTEFSRQELVNIIFEHGVKHKLLTPAINEFLQTQNLKAKKVQYADTLERVVCEVESVMADDNITMFGKPEKQTIKRAKMKNHHKPNIGLYSFMIAYLTKAKEANGGKPTIVQFDKLAQDIRFDYPKADDHRLGIYLHDNTFKRNNIYYDGATRTISVK